MRPSTKHVQKPLTTTELEMMNVVWRLGRCTVHQVIEELRPHRTLAYSSVSTMVRILEQKGFVSSEKEGRGHLYTPSISKETYQVRSLRHMVQHVFDGTPTLLVQRLVNSEQLNPADLERIRRSISKKNR
ncbi:MAG: BlaI/MecI/CopY family transcriptional regulator [Steroidobacteraceae bacterium]